MRNVTNLTPREEEVMTLWAQGKHDKEIAQTLCLSVSTIAGYLRNIYEKLEAHNRVGAVNAWRAEQ